MPGHWYRSSPLPVLLLVLGAGLAMRAVDRFMALPLKAVVGASANRDKFGNKVLRCLLQHGMRAVPVNKLQDAIEGVECAESLTSLSRGVLANKYPPSASMRDVGVSIITPPGVTLLILQEAYALGVREFFLQPGTWDSDVDACIRDHLSDASCIKSCVMVELGFSDVA